MRGRVNYNSLFPFYTAPPYTEIMDDMRKTLDLIMERNARVEADKAWETSWTRKLTIVVITYLTVSVFLFLIGTRWFYVHALVPTGGYFLSTLSIPWIKTQWMKKRNMP